MKAIRKMEKKLKDKYNLANNWEKIAYDESIIGDFPESKKAYLKVVDLRKELAEELNTTNSKAELAMSLYNLAYTELNLMELQEAKEAFLESIELSKELFNSEISEINSSLANAYYYLGITNVNLEALEEAEESYLKAIEIQKEINKSLEDNSGIRKLIYFLNGLLGIQEELDKKEEAQKTISKVNKLEEILKSN